MQKTDTNVCSPSPKFTQTRTNGLANFLKSPFSSQRASFTCCSSCARNINEREHCHPGFLYPASLLEKFDVFLLILLENNVESAKRCEAAPRIHKCSTT